MRLFSGIDIGREALMAHGLAMAAVGDNIANSSTVGYKGQRPQFGDLLAESVGSLFGSPLAPGNGSFIDELKPDLSGGAIEPTARELDAAIEGNGFFTVENASGERYYTRAGNFVTNVEGELVTADGDLVLGFTAESPEEPVPIVLTELNEGATATSNVTLYGNLDAGSGIAASVPNPTTFDELKDAAKFIANISIVDSVGSAHDVPVYFFHTSSLIWEAQVYLEPEDTGATTTAPVAVSSPVTITMGAGGVQTASTPLNINTTWSNGGTSTFAVDLSELTGFGIGSNLTSVIADGRPAGQLSGVRFDKSGTIYAVLNNGSEAPFGTLALARFANPYGIERVGDNKFAESEESGEAALYSPNTNGVGTIAPESLENSNVDLATQFIDLIKYQRGYQANSKVIQTASEMITTTIQIA